MDCHAFDEKWSTRTSIGLKNATETPTGPTSKEKIVRVRVVWVSVTFD
jgi:hypothetical protein